MKRSFHVCAALFLLLTVLVPTISPSYVRAAAKPLAGFMVAPAQLSFTIQPGANTQTSTLTISNTYDISLRLVADLRSIDESSARLVPTGPVDEKLGQAIKLSATDITVPAQGTYQLEVAVDGTSLSDGGHYASLVLTQRSNTTVANGYLSAVSINFFIIKNENIRTNLQLTKFHTNRTLFTLPSTATTTFRNLGNTHIIPRASVSIFDGQNLVAKSVINATSLPLFPGQQSNFAAPFETYSKLLLPRKLHVRLMYRIDSSDIQYLSEQSFWYVPIIDLIVLIVVGILIWWRRRQIRRLFIWLTKTISRMQRKRDKTPKKLSTTRRTTTKRILGRTVIRSHQASTRSAVKATPRLQETHSAPSITIQPAKKRIVVTIAEEAVVAPVKPPTQQPTVKQPVIVTTTKPKTSSKQSKTVKIAPKATTKTTTSKTPKKTAKAAPKKIASKPRKTTSQSKPSKTK